MFFLTAPVKSISKDELNGCVLYLFNALEDRNADVRKSSNEAVFPFMLHLGYEGMSKHVSRIKVTLNVFLKVISTNRLFYTF